MSLKKQYLKTKPLCKVTFRLNAEAAQDAKEAALCGDFTDWKSQPLTMKKLKSGDFTLTVDLEKDHEYQFRYLIDGEMGKRLGSRCLYSLTCEHRRQLSGARLNYCSNKKHTRNYSRYFITIPYEKGCVYAAFCLYFVKT